MVENGEQNGEILFFLKNGDLNLKIFSHKYFISSLECISMIVYTNVENHLFSSLIITLLLNYSNHLYNFHSQFLIIIVN